MNSVEDYSIDEEVNLPTSDSFDENEEQFANHDDHDHVHANAHHRRRSKRCRSGRSGVVIGAASLLFVAILLAAVIVFVSTSSLREPKRAEEVEVVAQLQSNIIIDGDADHHYLIDPVVGVDNDYDYDVVDANVTPNPIEDYELAEDDDDDESGEQPFALDLEENTETGNEHREPQSSNDGVGIITVDTIQRPEPEEEIELTVVTVAVDVDVDVEEYNPESTNNSEAGHKNDSTNEGEVTLPLLPDDCDNDNCSTATSLNNPNHDTSTEEVDDEDEDELSSRDDDDYDDDYEPTEFSGSISDLPSMSNVTRARNNNNNNINARAVNKGEECSVVMPVDYSQKFQPGSGYESFPDYQCYRTVEGTNQTVNDLVTKYPNLASKVFLPNYTTAEGNIRLYALVITNERSGHPKASKGKMMAISAIHAREIATGETMLRFAEYLLQNYGKDPEVTWILDYMEVHLILHANPDGRIYLEKGGEHAFWKKNRNDSAKCNHWRTGVDLNRNFPFKFGQCDASENSNQRCSSSSDCQSVVYRGPKAKSERETNAIVEYAAGVFPVGQRKGSLESSESGWNMAFPESSAGVFLDMHSHGRDVGWPWGWKNKKTPNDDGLGALGRKFASYGEYSLWAPELPNRLYGFDGSTIDTMYGWLGAASFFFELGTSFYEPCETFPTVINEVFPSLLYAVKVAKEPYIAPQGPDILCTNISFKTNNRGKFVKVRVEISDDARIEHADDSGTLFSTGRQNIRMVEIFVNCHPYSGSNCKPRKRKNLSNAGKSITTSVQFKAPGRTNNVMYIRATDSGGYTGPITARSFVV